MLLSPCEVVASALLQGGCLLLSLPGRGMPLASTRSHRDPILFVRHGHPTLGLESHLLPCPVPGAQPPSPVLPKSTSCRLEEFFPPTQGSSGHVLPLGPVLQGTQPCVQGQFLRVAEMYPRTHGNSPPSAVLQLVERRMVAGEGGWGVGF